MLMKTINIEQETKDKLDKLKLVPNETYDHLINRILSTNTL